MLNHDYTLTDPQGFTMLDPTIFDKYNLYSYFLASKPRNNFKNVETLISNLRNFELISSTSNSTKKPLRHFLMLYNNSTLCYFRIYSNFPLYALDVKEQIKFILSQVVFFDKPMDVIEYYKYHRYEFSFTDRELRNFFLPIRRVLKDDNNRDALFVVEKLLNMK